MPSHRKRIGFLPSEEVHNIIEKISIENNYSQSKVTRILVEEALMSRGVLGNSFKNNSNIGKENISLKNQTKNFPKQFIKNSDDLKMINEFIEYKLFKLVMSQKSNINDQ